MYIVIILIMQLFDSYCAELFSKLQSFLLSDFLITKESMTLKEAVSYMGYLMLPFYVIPIMAPVARTLVDKIGTKRVFIANIFVLGFGCLICITSPNIILYMVGNALVIFASSMDIQYIYIARKVSEKRRATVRGMAGAVAAGAALLIPLLRTVMIGRYKFGWRSLYVVGIIMGLITLAISLFIKKESNEIYNNVEKIKKSKTKTKIFLDKELKYYLLILFIIGIATSGITQYNEPMVSFMGVDEHAVNIALMLQPIVTLLVNLISGILADILGRNKIVLGNVIFAIVSTIIFVVGINNSINVVLIGIVWGGMIGCYFTAANLLTLTLLEKSEKGKIGKVSALSTIVNGFGNCIGILVCTVCVKYTGMGAIKLITTIPVLFVAMILLGRRVKVS